MEATSAPHIILGRVDDAINQVASLHADARLRADAGGSDGGVRQELAAGVVLRSGGRSTVGGNPGKRLLVLSFRGFEPKGNSNIHSTCPSALVTRDGSVVSCLHCMN